MDTDPVGSTYQSSGRRRRIDRPDKLVDQPVRTGPPGPVPPKAVKDQRRDDNIRPELGCELQRLAKY